MNKPKGTKDIYGERQVIRMHVSDVLAEVAKVYNFKRIDTPIFERKEVFVRSVGETSDIVSKEMYDFEDKKGRKMVLRPEGTAGTIRAIVENKLFAEPLPLKVYYQGPMFRYENPQKGRQRQFTQFGVEMLSDRNPYADAEIIMMGKTILDSLHIDYELIINSLGDKKTRDTYSSALKEYFENFKDKLTDDSVNRLDKNPMRILDDKIDGKKDFVKNAPKISDFYSSDVKEYFDKVISFLENMNINYKVDETLVRGLDYYTDTAFEFVSLSDEAGSQSTILGGGRYSNLVKEFGGPDLSGVGFGLGLERLVNDVSSLVDVNEIFEKPHAFVLNISNDVQGETLALVDMLRVNGFIIEWNQKPLKISKAFEKAEKSGSKINIIAGLAEIKKAKVNVKINGMQETIAIEKLVEYLDSKLSELSEKEFCDEKN